MNKVILCALLFTILVTAKQTNQFERFLQKQGDTPFYCNPSIYSCDCVRGYCSECGCTPDADAGEDKEHCATEEYWCKCKEDYCTNYCPCQADGSSGGGGGGDASTVLYVVLCVSVVAGVGVAWYFYYTKCYKKPPTGE